MAAAATAARRRAAASRPAAVSRLVIWTTRFHSNHRPDRGRKVGLSIPAAKEATRLDPRQTDAKIILCSDYTLSGARDQARQIAREIIRIDPSFRLSTYAASQPYRDTATLDHLINNLREAGLPE